jgi:large repetitive protein
VLQNGDLLTAIWDPTGITDVSMVTVDFSAFGGGSAVAATLQSSGFYSGKYTASATISTTFPAASNRNVAFTVTDTAGNVTTGSDTSNATINNNPLLQNLTLSLPYGSVSNGAVVVDLNDAKTGSDQSIGNLNLSFSITAGNTTGAFAINPATGSISVADVTKITAGSTFSLTLQASDGSNSSSATVGITYVDSAATQSGTSSNETITGTALDDLLQPGAGNDSASGGAGSDLLAGGTGQDTITSGTGSDAIYNPASGQSITLGSNAISGFDTVTDFALASGSASGDALRITEAGVTPFIPVDQAGIDGNNSSLTISRPWGWFGATGNYSVTGHQVSKGIASFSGSGGTITITSNRDVAAVVDYLRRNDFGPIGTTVAFTATISSTAYTYAYTQTSDQVAPGTTPNTFALVGLQGTTSTSLTTNASATLSGSLLIASNLNPFLSTAASPALTGISEDVADASNTGTTIATIVGSSAIVDLDSSVTQAIAVTEVDSRNGSWQWKLSGGSSWTTIASDLSPVNALLLDSGDSLRFVPTTNYNGSATFNCKAWDKSIGTAGTYASTATTQSGLFAEVFDYQTGSTSLSTPGVPSPNGATGATALGTLVTRRVDTQINVVDDNYGTNYASGADTFAVRWTGQVLANNSSITFYTNSDDGVRLWVNGSLVINNWTDHATINDSGTVTGLTAGQWYDIQFDFYENTGGNLAQLAWGDSGTLIPTSNLRTVVTGFSGNTDSASITVSAVNDNPVATAGGTLAYTENGSAAAIDASIVLTDADSANLTGATVSITAGLAAAEDTLAFSNTNSTTFGNIAASYNSSTGVLTLTSASSTATVAQFQTALRAVTYVNSSDNPSTTSRTVSFQANDGSANSNITTSTITVAAVNDAAVTGAGGNTLAYNENGAAAVINGSLTLTDADNATLSSATVSITAGLAAAEDTLAFSNTNSTTFGNIAASYNSSTGVLTLTSAGSTATVAQFQAALRAVTYVNSSDNPSTTSRTVSFQANDGSANSNIITSTITVAAVNDAPTVSAGSQSVQLVEASGIANATAGTSSATITLTKADVDGTATYDTSYLTTNSWSTADSGATYTKTGTYGTATFTIATGVVSYSLNNNATATQALTANQAVSDSFGFIQVTDGTATTLTAAISFAITGGNDAPTVSAGLTSSASEGAASYTLNLLTGASDADSGDTYSLNGATASATVPAGFSRTNGVLTIDPTNSAFNSLAVGQSSVVVVYYNVVDAQNATVAQTATITINGTNDRPTLSTFTAPVASCNDNTQQLITLANLTSQGDEGDVDGTVSAFVVKAVSSGTLLIGSSAGTATAWAAGSNDLIDDTRNAYWTSAVNAAGEVQAFTVVAKDDGGLNSATPIAVLVTVSDKTAPTAAVAITAITTDTGSSASDFITNDTSLVIAGTNGALGTGEKVQITTDGSTWFDVTPTTASSWTYTDPTSRSSNITYQARVIDAATNVGNTASRLVVIDTTSASGTFSTTIGTDSGATNTITAPGATKDNTLAFSGTASDAGGLSKVELYDGTTKLGEAFLDGSNWTFTTAALADGNHSFTARVYDLAGNPYTVTSEAITVRVDTTAPGKPAISFIIDDVVPATANVFSGGSTNDDTPTVRVSLVGTAAVAGDQVQLFGSLNGGSITSYGSPVTITATNITDNYVNIPTASLGQGSYSFTVKITDQVGNTSEASSAFTLIIDQTAPAAPSLTLASDTGTSGSDGITSNGLFNVSGLVAGFVWQYSTNGGVNWTRGSGSSFTVANGSYAANAILVRQADLASNLSANGIYDKALIVDTSLPTVAISSSKPFVGLVNGSPDTALITFAFSEDPSTSFTKDDINITGGTISEVSGSGFIRTAVFTPTTASSTAAVISVASGKYTDLAGNGNVDGADANNTVTINVNTQPSNTSDLPIISAVTLSSGDSGTTGDWITNLASQTISGSLSSALASNETLRISLDNGTSWQTVTVTAGATSFSFNTTLTSSAQLIGRVEATVTGSPSVLGNEWSRYFTYDNSTYTGSLSLTDYTGTISNGAAAGTDRSFGLALLNAEPGASVVYQRSADGVNNWSATIVQQDNLGDATYYYRAVVTDTANNTVTSPVLSVTVDGTAPGAPTLALGNGLTGTLSKAQLTAANGAILVTTTEASATVTLTLSSDAQGSSTVTKTFTSSGSSQSVLFSSSDAALLGDGTLKANATINDVAGNTTNAAELSFGYVAQPVLIIGDLSISRTQNGTEAGPSDSVFIISRTGVTDAEATITYRISGSAIAGTDFNYATGSNYETNGYGTIKIAAGSSTATISLSTIDNLIVNNSRSIMVSLNNTVAYNLVSTASSATATLVDNETAVIVPTITVSDLSVIEGSSGTSKTISLDVNLSQTTTVPVTVSYSFRDGTAIAGGTASAGGMDYAGTSGTLTFAAGTPKQTISFTISSDTIVESDEVFYLDLTSANGATFLGGGNTLTSKLTILNDDTAAPVDPYAGQTVTLTSPGSITGTDLNDALTGSNGNDTIAGGLGNDLIAGMAGADVLTSGGGGDKFIYASFADSKSSGYDSIIDFNSADGDRIALSALPSKFWNLGTITGSNLSTALASAYGDADRTTTGSQALGSGEAMLFRWGTSTATRTTYLVVENPASISQSDDLFLVVNGLALSAVGSASVSNVFATI